MEPPATLVETPAEAAGSGSADSAAIARSLVEPRAFDTVYRRHARAIFVYVAARVGPYHAEDVVAEVFAAAFTARRTFDQGATSARPWLYGIAVNKLHHHRAAEVRWLHQPQVAERDPEVEGEDRSDERLDAHAVVPELAAALAQLTAAERDVLVLHVFEGLTHREIAQALGIRRGTAKVRLHRGRERLRAALDEGGGER
jgi:RNA polymerase sigma factor (sigma-70 family)